MKKRVPVCTLLILFSLIAGAVFIFEAPSTVEEQSEPEIIETYENFDWNESMHHNQIKEGNFIVSLDNKATDDNTLLINPKVEQELHTHRSQKMYAIGILNRELDVKDLFIQQNIGNEKTLIVEAEIKDDIEEANFFEEKSKVHEIDINPREEMDHVELVVSGFGGEDELMRVKSEACACMAIQPEEDLQK